MAFNRTDAPSDAADASAETAPIAVPGAAPGGFRAWLPLLVTVIAMPVLAWVTTIYVLLPRMQRGLGIQPVAAAEANKKGTGVARRESFTMSKLLVNVSGTMGARYLLVSISITSNTACNLIRGELISGFNTILGGQVVQDIYFTEFAVQ